MNTENETQLNIKKEMIQTEIIDKNYDKTKFFEYCTNHKENGDDLSNWTILELNEVISDFIALQTSTKPTQEETTSNPQQQQQEQQSPQTSTTQQISNDIIKTVDTTQSTSSLEENVIEISALQHEGIEKIHDKIEEMVFAGTDRNSSDLVVTNSRHKDALYKAKQSIEDALNAIESYMPLDFVEVDFKNIWDYLGYINGDTVTEDLLDTIFSNFCIGK
jgi:tRNA U34 5-carboxymethylaminomethyl modifying GTPase MnmE/TrmE